MKRTKMLKKNYEFKKVLSKGNYYFGSNIEAFILKTNTNILSLGLAISVKVAKAVKRNKIKRLIRENYKILEPQLKDGYSIVFLWRKKANIKDANFKNIQNDMVKIFDKAKILVEEESI